MNGHFLENFVSGSKIKLKLYKAKLKKAQTELRLMDLEKR